MYIPKPVKTTDIQLPEDLTDLSEQLAKQVHEIWAEGRLKDGWTFGKERNDEKKETPCLVPYEDLTEQEKQYDRNTSQETLRFLLKLGYKIEKI